MTDPLRARLAALIAEWRERFAIGTRNVRATDSSWTTLKMCADELDAALRAAPEGERDTMNEIPRRNRIDHWVSAEHAIQAAVEAVEAMPADVRLTDAVGLLGQARTRVADYVDGVRPGHCPRCDSPSPEQHPAVQWDGNVQPCGHRWHVLAARADAPDPNRCPATQNGVQCSGLLHHDASMNATPHTFPDAALRAAPEGERLPSKGDEQRLGELVRAFLAQPRAPVTPLESAHQILTMWVWSCKAHGWMLHDRAIEELLQATERELGAQP